jgi:outer membrane receptor protein involved in Fe transport
VVGDQLLRRPDHQFSADVLLSAGPVSAFFQGGARSTVRDVDPSFGTFGGLYDGPGYNVWNTGASWTWIRLQLFGRVTNLFDRDYEESLGYPALGRSAMVGLRVAARR